MKKINRVRKSQEFQKLIHTGKKVTNGQFALYYLPKKENMNRIGITLSKKIGNAVERNKLKRQVRMMCEELIDFDTCKFDAIIIVRFGYKDNNYATNKKSLEKLFNKATML